jgi:hypothetical protein
MKKPWWIGAGLAVAALFALFVYPGLLRGVESHFTGACRALPTAAGVGDISIDNARDVAYMAYLDRTPTAGKAPRGTVMLVDLNAPEPRVRAALVTDPPDFRPVALSLQTSAQGVRRLFVVDSSTSPAAIQIFEQSTSGGFAHVKTVRDPLLVNTTAIVAVGPEQFYATTDAAWLDPSVTSRLLRAWRLLFPLSRSTVVFYDGQRMSADGGGDHRESRWHRRLCERDGR